MFDFIKNLGTTEIIIILVIVVVLFGSNKVKELSHGLGESTKELKKVKSELETTTKE